MTQAEQGLERLAKLLGDLGYRADVADGVGVRSSFSGTHVYLQWYEGGSIQIIAGWTEPPASFDVSAVNDFNMRFRFGSAYIINGSVNLQANFLFDLYAENASETLDKAIQIFEGLIQELLNTVKSGEEQAAM